MCIRDRAYYDVAEALVAALVALQADPSLAIALEAGPATLTGTDAGPPRLEAALPAAAPGTLHLGPALAADAMAGFQLMLAGWEATWSEDPAAGTAYNPPGA